MLKQFSDCAIRRAVLTATATLTIAFCIAACGIKGPLVPAPKTDASSESPPAAPSSSPLIKDPAQPERRP